VESFQAASLAPPPGVASGGGLSIGETDQSSGGLLAPPPPPLSLPVTLTQVPPEPGGIYVQNGSFGRRYDASRMAARLAGLGNAQVIVFTGEGRTLYAVQSGPYPAVAQADQALAATLQAGGVDATITVR
jgi:cell division septation protein DedD